MSWTLLRSRQEQRFLKPASPVNPFHEKTDQIHVEMLERFVRVEKLLSTDRKMID